LGFVFFTGIQQVWTTRCTLLRSWGGSKFNYNIGKLASCGDCPSEEQPQDVVVVCHSLEGALNHAMGVRLSSYVNIVFG